MKMHPKLTVGTRVALAEPVDNFPTIIVETGETGIVTDINDDMVWVLLDVEHPELAEWNNKLEIWREEGRWNDTLPLRLL